VVSPAHYSTNMCTIDAAFIDRADIKQYIGLPGDKPRYEIIASCLHELIKKGLIEGGISLPTHAEATAETTFHTDSARKVAELMLEAANATEVLSMTSPPACLYLITCRTGSVW
jgi:hypothetical protein